MKLFNVQPHPFPKKHVETLRSHIGTYVDNTGRTGLK